VRSIRVLQIIGDPYYEPTIVVHDTTKEQCIYAVNIKYGIVFLKLNLKKTNTRHDNTTDKKLGWGTQPEVVMKTYYNTKVPFFIQTVIKNFELAEMCEQQLSLLLGTHFHCCMANSCGYPNTAFQLLPTHSLY